MRPSLVLVLAVASVACGRAAIPADAPNAPASPTGTPSPIATTPSPSPAIGTPVSICGTLIDYRAPTANNVGSLIVDEEHFFVAADARTSVAIGATAGSAVCVDGRWVPHAAGRSLTQLTLSSRPGVSPSPIRYVTQENLTLGYRVSLPEAYRRYVASAGPDGSGTDIYTKRSGDLCARSPDMDSDVQVEVERSAMDPVEFASTPNRRMPFTSIQPTTVNTHPVARVVYDPTGDTEMLVVSANARLYVIRPAVGSQPSRQPTGWLDRIAQSFVALPPDPPATQRFSSPCGSR